MIFNHRIIATPTHRAPIEQWVRYYRYAALARN